MRCIARPTQGSGKFRDGPAPAGLGDGHEQGLSRVDGVTGSYLIDAAAPLLASLIIGALLLRGFDRSARRVSL